MDSSTKVCFEELYFHYYSSLTYLMLDQYPDKQDRFVKAVTDCMYERRTVSSKYITPKCLLSVSEDLMKEFLPINDITCIMFDLLSLKEHHFPQISEFSDAIRKAVTGLNRACHNFLGNDRINIRLFNEQIAKYVFQRETYRPDMNVSREHHYIQSNYRTETSNDDYRWLTHPEEQTICTHTGKLYCGQCFAERKKVEADNECSISFNYCDYY